MQSKSYNHNNKITVVSKLSDTLQQEKKPLPEAIADLSNRLTSVQKFIDESYKKVLNIDQNISIMRLEDIAILRLMSKNILTFRIEQLIYDSPNHIILYVRTKDEFYRYEINKEDWVNIDEQQIENEKSFYCSMYEDLVDFDARITKGQNKELLERIKTVGEICK